MKGDGMDFKVQNGSKEGQDGKKIPEGASYFSSPKRPDLVRNSPSLQIKG
jgi:hypothetical protein